MASWASWIDVDGQSPTAALYLGNYTHAKPQNRKRLADSNVRLVVNVASVDPIVGQETQIYDRLFAELAIETIRFPWDDRDDFEEKLNMEEFRIAVRAIDKVLLNGGSVLLHCRQGKSRSGTLTVAYVVAKTRCSVNEALAFVKKCREVAHPNDGFLHWLQAHEDELSQILASPVHEAELRQILHRRPPRTAPAAEASKAKVSEAQDPLVTKEAPNLVEATPTTKGPPKGKGKGPPPAAGQATAKKVPTWKQKAADTEAKLRAWKVPAESIVRSDSQTKLGREDFFLPDPRIAEKETDSGAQDLLKLVCFDFDYTLAAMHLYDTMAQVSAASGELFHAMLIEAFTERFGSEASRVFGGECRLDMLRARLRMLRSARVQLWIITMGSPHLVDHVLGKCGLRDFFAGITDDNPKQHAVQVIMNRFDRRLRADQALLVDDSESNLNDRRALTQEDFDEKERTKDISPEYRQLLQAACPCGKGAAFPLGAIVPGNSGYCQVMRVDATGMTEEHLDLICERAIGKDRVGQGA